MKKQFIFLLTIAMIVSMVSCQGQNVNVTSVSNTRTQEDVVFQEVVIFDTEDIKVTLSDFKLNGKHECSMRVKTEIQDENARYSLSATDGSINGMHLNLNSGVLAEYSSVYGYTTDRLYISDIAIFESGIDKQYLNTDYTEIKLNFTLFHLPYSSKEELKPTLEQSITIYPFGEEVVELYDPENGKTESGNEKLNITLLDNEYVKIKIDEFDNGQQRFHKTMMINTQNKSDIPIVIYFDGLSINGIDLSSLHEDFVSIHTIQGANITQSVSLSSLKKATKVGYVKDVELLIKGYECDYSGNIIGESIFEEKINITLNK